MPITDIKRNKGNNIGHVGLALISEIQYKSTLHIHYRFV